MRQECCHASWKRRQDFIQSLRPVDALSLYHLRGALEYRIAWGQGLFPRQLQNLSIQG